MLDTVSQNNRRIVKNTMFLYLRMGLTMLVQLYTSRVVLDNLGVENYGIYSVVASFIVAFTFIKGPLTSATQRYLNFELGRNDNIRLNKVFNLSLLTYAILALVLVVILELVGEWFVSVKMQIPPGRGDAALWTFRLSVFALIFSVIKTPFESLVIAYERMSFYAYLGIAEVVLKLLNAFSLAYIGYDKLKIYAVNHLIITIVLAIVVFAFCKICFKNVKIQKIWDGKLLKEILSFSGWSLFGAVASMCASQGLNILLNMFYGVAVNAAMGLASQVNTAIRHFVQNFQTAFRPQLVKYYAAGEIKQLNNLIFSSSKFSYLLLFAIACPFCFNVEYILKVWLKNPPELAGIFCIYMLIYALLESISAPMWMAIQATGKIKLYQITINSVMMMNIVLSYVFLKMGFDAVIVLQIKCILDVFYLVVRMLFIRRMVKFNIPLFMKQNILPILGSSGIAFVFLLAEVNCVPGGFTRLIVTCISFVVLYIPLVWLICLSQEERFFVKQVILRKILKRRV